jgi:hypothetical protein
LTRFTPPIRGLTVTISDENGLRGGVDKNCRLVVRLHAGTVVVNEQADEVLAALGGNDASQVNIYFERNSEVRRCSNTQLG